MRLFHCTETRVKPDLCNLSAEEARSLWISGVHFQRSLRGAGSSLTLAALTSFDGLPILFSHGNTTSFWWPYLDFLNTCQQMSHSCILRFQHPVSYMYLSRYSVHCTRTIPSNGECSHTTPQQPSAPTTNWHSQTIFLSWTNCLRFDSFSVTVSLPSLCLLLCTEIRCPFIYISFTYSMKK